jgi:Cdc25 family phosphatase
MLDVAAEEHPTVHHWSVLELANALQPNPRPDVGVLDVRTDSEYAGGRIQGAMHVPSETFTENPNTGENYAKEILFSFAGRGIKVLVVHCMYSQCRGPLVANMLASLLKAVGLADKMEVCILDGGFHKFLNAVRTKNDTVADVPGLIQGLDARKWRKTAEQGLVEADAVQTVEELLSAGSNDGIKSLLKMHQGKLTLADLDDIVQRANPRFALSSEELKTLFAMAPKKDSGYVDWHEFIDFVYSSSSNNSADNSECQPAGLIKVKSSLRA